ncbi:MULTISPECIES: hypothetical protein [Streptomyces]|uniref:hypothetical protein n=1 Tax=Streptomyces TaxID=1883 RepID=UPI000BD4CBDD|nr:MULTISPECIES: hypothetical protein [Streptomyces]MCX4435373.1 hypothetical protein [Streptomyces mirabilis]SOE71459.1 hypothetical protein SAMN05446589_4056 [Streptomyces sp. OV198]
MGERLGGHGVPGRRRVHPGGAASDTWEARDAATLETELGAVLRGHLEPEAEQRALTAFRAAHDTGAHRARTRRRDDWRLPAERRARRPVKLTLGVVFASLTLGGVAVATIGSVGSSTDGDGAGRGTVHPSAVAPDQPGGGASSASSGVPGPTDRPATAKDTEAHCRAYEQVKDRGKALDSRAWQRLVTAAGGKDKVAAYCSEQLARATAAPSKTTGNGKAGSAGASGKGTSGGTDNTAGNGRASGEKGSGKHK